MGGSEGLLITGREVGNRSHQTGQRRGIFFLENQAGSIFLDNHIIITAIATGFPESNITVTENRKAGTPVHPQLRT